MTAVSLSLSRGQFANNMSDVRVGSSAPGTGDFEFRFNVLDTNSKNVNDLDLVLALKAMIRYVETGGPTSGVAVTNQPSGPPN